MRGCWPFEFSYNVKPLLCFDAENLGTCLVDTDMRRGLLLGLARYSRVRYYVHRRFMILFMVRVVDQEWGGLRVASDSHYRIVSHRTCLAGFVAVDPRVDLVVADELGVVRDRRAFRHAHAVSGRQVVNVVPVL